MDKYKRLASNTLILTIGQFSSRFLVIIMMKFYTEMLKTDGYGTVGLIIDACVIIMTIVTLSINDSIIRYGLDRKYDKSQVFSIGLTTTLGGLLVFAAIVPFLGTVPMFSGYTLWIYFYVFCASLKSCCALFARSAGYVRLYAIDGIFTTVMNIIFNLIFMLGLGFGVKGYLLSVILADLCSTIFVFYTANLKNYLILFGLDRHLRGSMLRFSLPLIPTAVMWWVTGLSSGFFIERFMDIDATGIFKAAYRFPNIIIIISLIFSQAWNMSAITEKNSRTISRFYSNVFNIFQSAVYIMAAGLMLVIRPALVLMTRADFHGAYKFSAFLIMAVIFSCFSTFSGSVYVASKKSMRSMVTAFIGAVLNIGLNFALIPLWGLQGAAIATFFSYIVVFIVRAADTRKIVLMDLKIPKMTVNMIILLAMTAIIMTVGNSALYYTGLSVLFAVALIINFRSAISAIKLIKESKSQ